MVKDHEWKMITLSNVLLDSQLHKRERLLPQSYHLAPRLGVKCIQIYTSQFFGVQFVCMLIGFQKVLFFFFFLTLWGLLMCKPSAPTRMIEQFLRSGKCC